MSDTEEKPAKEEVESPEPEEEEEEEEEEVEEEVKEEKDRKENERTSPKKAGTKKEEKEDVKYEEKNGEDKDEESEEEEEDEDDEDDGNVPLLDQPLELSGARDRKKVERYSYSSSPDKKEKTEIPEGKGQRLGDCPGIEHFIMRKKGEDLVPLHRILFGRHGGKNEIKKNVRQFSGFPFDQGTADWEKKKANLEKINMNVLKQVCEILNIERGGTKTAVVKRVMDFLSNPEDSGEDPPKARAKRKRSSTTKRQKRSRRGKAGKKKGKKVSKDSEDSSDVSEELEKEEENDEVEDSDEDYEESKKKKAKTANAKKAVQKKKVEPKKENKKQENKKNEKPTEKKPAPKKRKAVDSDEEMSSSDDEPLVKKAKQAPTDEEIKAFVKKILEGANLEEVTMKTVCKQVYAEYPDFDLTNKKDFIKSTVRSIIS